MTSTIKKKKGIWKHISFVPCFSVFLRSWGTNCKAEFSITPVEIYFPCHMDKCVLHAFLFHFTPKALGCTFTFRL